MFSRESVQIQFKRPFFASAFYIWKRSHMVIVLSECNDDTNELCRFLPDCYEFHSELARSHTIAKKKLRLLP